MALMTTGSKAFNKAITMSKTNKKTEAKISNLKKVLKYSRVFSGSSVIFLVMNYGFVWKFVGSSFVLI
jgi:hypothetical protein